ncbi:MAG: hypothetical protein JEY99_19295 [Spirochaetales bacterium]|nr:hypothetical protein [Spirochaetales bacterium]
MVKSKIKVIFTLSSLVFLMIISCENGAPSDQLPITNHKIVGTFRDGFSVDNVNFNSKSISSSISSIASFNVIASGLVPNEPEPVDVDGSFEVELEADNPTDVVLLFIDDESEDVQSRFDRAGFIVLDAGDGEGMARIPVSGSTFETIDLGSISFDEANGQGVSSLDQAAQADIFGLDFSDLQSFYRYDNVLREAHNIYVNDDPQSEQFCQAWMSQSETFGLSSIRNSYSSVTAVALRVLSVGFNVTNPSDHSYTEIQSDTVLIEVVPPDDIILNVSGSPYGPEHPLASNDSTDWGGAWTIGPNDISEGSYSIGIDLDADSGIPGGTWVIKKDGEILALFAFSSLTPFDEEGHFLYFIPSIKASVEEDGMLTRLELRWYSYDHLQGEYVELADPSIVDQWFIQFGFGVGGTIDNSGSEPSLIEEISQSKTEITEFENNWYFDSVPDGGVGIGGIWILYSIGNMSFSFYYAPEEDEDLSIF